MPKFIKLEFFAPLLKSFKKMKLVFSLYFSIYFYRVYSETNSLLRFENNLRVCQIKIYISFMSGLLSFYFIDYIPNKYVLPDPFKKFIYFYSGFTASIFLVSLGLLFSLIWLKQNKHIICKR